MAFKNLTPEHIAATIFHDLHKNLAATQICYTEYMGEIKQSGDTVRFPGLNRPTVQAYTGSVTYTEPTDAGAVIKVDQDNYYGIKIESLDEKRSVVSIQKDQAREAMYELQDICDTYILGLAQKLPEEFAVTVTPANVLSTIARAKQVMLENNVPMKMIKMVYPPWMETMLSLAGIVFQIKNGSDAGDGVSYAKVLGVDVYISNNVYQTGGVDYVMCLSGRAIAFADQMMESQVINPHPNFFGAGIRGRHVFGADILRPKEVIRLSLTEGTISTI